MADAGGALAPPGGQERGVQVLRGAAARRCRRSFGGGVGFRQDALLVFGGEGPALGFGDDFGVGVGARFGAGFAAAALRSLSLRSGSLRATGSKAAGGGAETLWVFMYKRIFLALLSN